MSIMTKQEFKTESHKYWSLRDGAIKDIDNQLERYEKALKTNRPVYDLIDSILDVQEAVNHFIEEKEKKYSDSTKTQSTNRKKAVDKLKKQIEEQLIEYESELSEIEALHVTPVNIRGLSNKAIKLH